MTFRYRKGEEVQVGDRIRYANQDAVVEAILQPGTQEAADYHCPEGGILTTAFGHTVFPANADWEWEDVEFVRRNDGSTDQDHHASAG